MFVELTVLIISSVLLARSMLDELLVPGLILVIVIVCVLWSLVRDRSEQ